VERFHRRPSRPPRRLDRFARSAADGLAAVRRIEQAGGTFVSVAENVDSSSPYGRFTMTIFLALAELEPS
jgi:site-specific DNA recombinase